MHLPSPSRSAGLSGANKAHSGSKWRGQGLKAYLPTNWGPRTVTGVQKYHNASSWLPSSNPFNPFKDCDKFVLLVLPVQYYVSSTSTSTGTKSSYQLRLYQAMQYPGTWVPGYPQECLNGKIRPAVFNSALYPLGAYSGWAPHRPAQYRSEARILAAIMMITYEYKRYKW
eukprot:2686700-Rhodomonas_salina.2